MTAPASPLAHAAAPPHVRRPIVRFATPDDDAFIDDLHAVAFGPGRFARTAFRIRERFPIDPSLSMIAEVDGQRCGCVWMTPIGISGFDGYLLGPLATHPDFRKLGAGKLLAREVTRHALDRREGRFVLLVGDRDYYCPLGWEPAAVGAIRFPGPVDQTRVLIYSREPELAQGLAGTIGPFRGLRDRPEEHAWTATTT